ncbi:MAG TPA: SET domain-containing protein-lysine N-methyltransferase [Dehalococcoidia bacterium]|nr:SET domain-containing protein-lysine N-methyltransferase [Dehalococcoidia bacterium]
MSQGWQDAVYVKTSPIHGLGVFARRTFATGETILVRDERPVTAAEPLDESAGEYDQHCDWLEGGRQVYLGFPERHVNHSCDANSFHRRIAGTTHLVALRPIHPGDEITNHYCIDLSAGEAWSCACGSERCLGMIPGDFFDLPLSLQIELQPLLSEWFIAEHVDQLEALMREAGLDQVSR